MATKTTKLAGPDTNGHYKVLQVRGHLQVKPGAVYSEGHVTNVLLRNPHVDTTIIEPKFDRGARRAFLSIGQPEA